MRITELKSQEPNPVPPPAQPPRGSKCGFDLKPNATNPNKRCYVPCSDHPFMKACSPESLRPYFGKFGEEVLRQASGICTNESKGRIDALNNRCLNTDVSCFQNGRQSCWTHDLSAGLFQINQIGVCVASTYREGQTHGPSCSIIPGVDPLKCLDERGLRAFDGNLKAAVDFYSRRNWQPWGYQCN
ncbi:MAG: hypothetical protein UZ22_OP11002000514 [Microgenomates bacterium OLB23]|nr:MAG: hypothetical protein UZ22_OP11002000514 [Microgenomates bacterium OLB23]